MKDFAAGTYIVEVTCLGYQTICDTLNIKGTCRRDYRLEEDVKELNEVMVVADRSQLVKRKANGEVFYLSADAKRKGNPFRALQEIPAIVSDANTASIKMLNGETPLILINGNLVNSGIAPISASEIESVEIIHSVQPATCKKG